MGGNVRSRAILITRTLSGSQDPQEYDTKVVHKIPAAIEAKAAAAEVAQASARRKAASENRSTAKSERAMIFPFSFRLFFTLHSCRKTKDGLKPY